jgi:hypothetical protein
LTISPRLENCLPKEEESSISKSNKNICWGLNQCPREFEENGCKENSILHSRNLKRIYINFVDHRLFWPNL